MEIMLLLTLKRQDFVEFLLLLENCAKYCLDPEPEPEPEQIITAVSQHCLKQLCFSHQLITITIQYVSSSVI